MAKTRVLRKGDYELHAFKPGKQSVNTYEPNPVNEGWTTEQEARTRIKELEHEGYYVHVSKLQGFQSLPGLGTATVSDSYYTTKGYYNWIGRKGEYVQKSSNRLTPEHQASITKRQQHADGTSFQTSANGNGSTTRKNIMTEQKDTTQAVAEALTISQKVDALNKEKADLTGQLNGADEASKPALQDRINVIDRKLRWYAGRSKDTARPTQAAKAKSERKPKAKKETAPAPASTEVPGPAIES